MALIGAGVIWQGNFHLACWANPLPTGPRHQADLCGVAGAWLSLAFLQGEATRECLDEAALWGRPIGQGGISHNPNPAGHEQLLPSTLELTSVALWGLVLSIGRRLELRFPETSSLNASRPSATACDFQLAVRHLGVTLQPVLMGRSHRSASPGSFSPSHILP